jgi:hypothetical protein
MSRSTRRLLRAATLAIMAAIALGAMPARASELVVLEARGGNLKRGQTIDGSVTLTLKEGERITLITPEGRSIMLRGPLSQAPLPPGASAPDPRQALAALVTAREARTSAIGVIRAGADAAALPEPWLIDVSREGERCLREGETPLLWRPDARNETRVSVEPEDRSWRAFLTWPASQDSLTLPDLRRFDTPTVLIVRMEDREVAIQIRPVPRNIDEPLVLASWLLQSGCMQQADALLRSLGAAVAPVPTPRQP